MTEKHIIYVNIYNAGNKQCPGRDYDGKIAFDTEQEAKAIASIPGPDTRYVRTEQREVSREQLATYIRLHDDE